MNVCQKGGVIGVQFLAHLMYSSLLMSGMSKAEHAEEKRVARVHVLYQEW